MGGTILKPKILVTEALGPEGLAYLREHSDLTAYDMLPAAELPGMIGEFDAVIIRSAHRITRDLIVDRPRLKVVARAGAGVDNVDLDACTELGIAVVNAPGANAIAAAEHTFGLLLSVMRNIRLGDLHVRHGGWDRQAHLGEELHGRRLGIIGLGRVGRNVARIAHGFRMEVFAYDPYITEDLFQANGAIRKDTLESLLEVSDVLTIHTPKSGPHLTEPLLRLLPRDAFALNVARGGLYDEDAVVRVLEDGHLAGFGCDVFPKEPPNPDAPLFKQPRVVVTPHLGGSTHEALANVGTMTARGVIETLAGITPPNLVNVPIPPLEVPQLTALDRMCHSLSRVFSQLNPVFGSRLILTPGRQVPAESLPWIRQNLIAGVLQNRVDERVNTVNALIKAKEHGLTLTVDENPKAPDALSLNLRWDDQPQSQAEFEWQQNGSGGLHLRQINDISFDLAWPDVALVTRHQDTPGVVGQIGTLLGEFGVNIGNLHLGRRSLGGEAIMVMALDTPPTEALRQSLLNIPGISAVYWFD